MGGVWWDRRIPPGRTILRGHRRGPGLRQGCVVVLWSDALPSDGIGLWKKPRTPRSGIAFSRTGIHREGDGRRVGFRRLEAADACGTGTGKAENTRSSRFCFNAIAHHVPRRERNRRKPGSERSERESRGGRGAHPGPEPSEVGAACRVAGRIPCLTPARRAGDRPGAGSLGRPADRCRYSDADGVPDIDWVTIPAGAFLMGSTASTIRSALDKDEKPQRKIELSSVSHRAVSGDERAVSSVPRRRRLYGEVETSLVE